MRGSSIAFLSTSFLTALIAALSIIILFVPFAPRSLKLDLTPSSSTTTDGYGFYTNPSFDPYPTENAYPYPNPTPTVYYLTDTQMIAGQDGSSDDLTTETYTYSQYARSIQTSVAKPPSLPRILERQESAAPTPTTTQISVPQSRVGGLLVIIILIVAAVTLIEATALGIYFAVKLKKLAQQRALDVNEGVAVPLAAETPVAESPGPGSRDQATESNPYQIKVVVSFARCHFSCLIILAILLLIPLSLLLYTVSVFNSASDLFSSVLVNRIGYSSYGSPTATICDDDGYECSVSDPDSLSNLSYWAGPVIGTLVLGWILFTSIIALAVQVCMRRGARRRKSRGKGKEASINQDQRDPSNNSVNHGHGLEMTQAQASPRGLYSHHHHQSHQEPILNSNQGENPYFNQADPSDPSASQQQQYHPIGQAR